MVAMNAETYSRDVREVAPGGYLVYDSTWPRPALLKREDITTIGVPLAKLCNENFNGVRTRILMKNICYAGVLVALLDLDLRARARSARRDLREEAAAGGEQHESDRARLRVRQGDRRVPAAAARSRKWRRPAGTS